jgi:hypothetical protein
MQAPWKLHEDQVKNGEEFTLRGMSLMTQHSAPSAPDRVACKSLFTLSFRYGAGLRIASGIRCRFPSPAVKICGLPSGIARLLLCNALHTYILPSLCQFFPSQHTALESMNV